VKVVAASVEVPLCIDSANPEALEAGLAVAPGKALVNSVNGEAAMLQAVLPIVKAHDAAVIGLTMDDDGIPNDEDAGVAIAGKILERAVKLVLPACCHQKLFCYMLPQHSYSKFYLWRSFLCLLMYQGCI